MATPENPQTIRDVMADLKARGFDAKLVWGQGPDGVEIGKRPPADPPSYATLSADCIVALCAWGRK